MATLKPDGRESAESSIVPIAKLLPVGQDSERAFDDVVAFPGLSEHHQSFIHAERIERKERTPVFSSDDTDADEHVVARTAVELWAGHYSLNLSNMRYLKSPGAGWRVGKGTSKFGNADREVDVLLIRPGKKSEDVSKVNALIQLHEKSGVLMLVGMSDLQPIEYESGSGGVPILLRLGMKHVLSQKVNRFSFGKLRFKLEFEDLTDAQHAACSQYRDKFFLDMGRPRPHPCLSMIPREGHIMRNSVLLHTAFGKGGHGHVHAAVDARTGAPLAVKDMWIDNESSADRPEFRTELKVSQAFVGTPGLLQAMQYQCQHLRKACPCGEYPEQIFISFPLAIRDFSMQNWSIVSLDTVAGLLRGPLQGLQAMHKTGCMHRDVSPKNLLIMSVDPPQAVLCDYGKAIYADEATSTKIGPIQFLAPEVGDPEGYRDKIDVWGVGLVCCWILFPEYIKIGIKKGSKPDIKWYRDIISLLGQYANRGRQQRSFGNLIEGMLRWSSTNRLTAAEALQHPFLQPSLKAGENPKRKDLLHKIPSSKKPATRPGPGPFKTPPIVAADGSGDTEIDSSAVSD